MVKKSRVKFQSSLENLEEIKKGLSLDEIAVLYSGGGDSLLVADILGETPHFSRVHLITYDNGASSHLELAATFIEELKRKHGEDRIIHQFRTNAELFRNLALNQHLVEDIQQYGNNYACVGCKLAMHADLIVYAILNGIGNISDGYNERQSKFPEQTRANMEAVDKLAEVYGIKYHSPLTGLVRTTMDRIHELGVRGLHTASVQPSCLFGASFRNLEGTEKETADISDYIAKRTVVVCSYIDHMVRLGLSQKRYDGNGSLQLPQSRLSF
jgi:predicted subunit of tRNA(5-methylaminomethyl-2-thiouridylate) methyltransferase